ncbi:MAG: S8 family serine peptidase, partial [Anaerolineae bacterium]
MSNQWFTNFKLRSVLLILLLTIVMLMIGLLPAVNAANIENETVVNEVDASSEVKTSHRLIVQLESPAVAETAGLARLANGRIDLQASTTQSYISRLQAEQAAFINTLSKALPDSSVATYINESGQSIEATYQIVFNGVAVDPGKTSTAEARRVLSKMPGVKAVYLDFAHDPDLYASLPLINAPTIWTEAGGQTNAGAGVKVASMDGGLHHAAPMFNGTGFSYPAGYGPNGLGDPANNNGKIIASRAYFRSWDPPSVGDENTWPGTQGTSHGTHTGSTAVGIPVTANYLGLSENISGVAPGAYAMSYRVFYNSVTNDGSFYNVEGIAALEDIVADGADVLNNSWGGGPGSVGGEFDPLDFALINAYKLGVFVSMSAGNAGPGLGTGDHPSAEYINVAASTTDGTLASGRLNIILPTPISPTLQGLSYSGADFGAPLPVG